MPGHRAHADGPGRGADPARRPDPRRRRRRRERGHRAARATAQPAPNAESLVTGLLLPDAPVVAWWPDDAPDGAVEDPIGRIAQRRITDAAAGRRPARGAASSRPASYAPGDTDLAWTRLTCWRGAAGRRARPAAVRAGHRGRPSPAPRTPRRTDLLAAWLRARAATCPVDRARSPAPDERDGRHHGRCASTAPSGDDRSSSAPAAAGDRRCLAQPGQPDRRPRARPAATPRATASPRSCAGSTRTTCMVECITADGAGRAARRRRASRRRRRPSRRRDEAAQRPRPTSRRTATARLSGARRRRPPDAALLAEPVAARLVTGWSTPSAARARRTSCSPAARWASAVARGARRHPRRGTRRLVARALLVGRRALPARRRPDRNETQARAALLDHVAARPGAGAPDARPRRRRRRRRRRRGRALRRRARRGCRGRRTRRRARLRHPAPRRRAGRAHRLAVPRAGRSSTSTDRAVVAVRGLAQAAAGAGLADPAGASTAPSEVWLVLAGADKAAALGLALAGAELVQRARRPAPSGRRRTVFFVDQAAAAQVPPALIAPSQLLTTTRRTSATAVGVADWSRGQRIRPRARAAAAAPRRGCASPSASVRRSFT